MNVTRWTSAGIVAMLASDCFAVVAAQTNNGTSAVERIDDDTGGCGLGYVFEELEKRYGFGITLEEPALVSAEDLREFHIPANSRGPARMVWAPRLRPFHFQYTTVNGKPQEDTTSLIRRLLSVYAAQGGPVYDVRERMTPNGPLWSVVPIKVRNWSGKFADAPDVLGTPISIPKANRGFTASIVEICKQLQLAGYQILPGSVPLSGVMREFGVDNQPARDALAELLAPELWPGQYIWQLRYDTEHGQFRLNALQAPGSLLNPAWRAAADAEAAKTAALIAAAKAKRAAHPPGPSHDPIPSVMRWSKMPGGIKHIQSLLAQAGYYTGEPTGRWGENTVDAVKKGQAANDLPVTGDLDPETIRKLGLDVITPPK